MTELRADDRGPLTLAGADLDPMRSWPTEVRRALDPRVAALRARAVGHTLELASTDLTAAAGRLDGESDGGDDGFDTVLSFGALTMFADLPEAIQAISDRLATGGSFRFIEPVGIPGWRGTLAATAGSHLPGLRASHIGRDVPAAVRHGGFIICSLYRFSPRTSFWPLRHFVEAHAMRAADLYGGASGGETAFVHDTKIVRDKESNEA